MDDLAHRPPEGVEDDEVEQQAGEQRRQRVPRRPAEEDAEGAAPDAGGQHPEEVFLFGAFLDAFEDGPGLGDGVPPFGYFPGKLVDRRHPVEVGGGNRDMFHPGEQPLPAGTGG